MRAGFLRLTARHAECREASGNEIGSEVRRNWLICGGLGIWVLLRMPYNVDIVNVTPIAVDFT